jgi:hypothetical protein
MALNATTQNPVNPQLLQQRLNVREQEISALKVQNRHLLEKIEELEKKAEPNKIDTSFVADEVKRTLDPVIQQLKTTMTSSFEVLQSTMRGIYQQSQRSEKAVSDLSAHTRELEIRLNDQRKQDQNFYQDKVFSMIGNFCDRLERQIEIRLKALGAVEMIGGKQNEILGDLESLKSALGSIQRNSESGRSDLNRMEKNNAEVHRKLADVEVQAVNSGEIARDTLQQIHNHRAEFRLIRAELRQTVAILNGLLNPEGEQVRPVETAPDSSSGRPWEESETLETMPVEQASGPVEQDAAMALALLRARKSELQRAAQEARNYIKSTLAGVTGSGKKPIANEDAPAKEP